jgi:hypothetical protein
MLTDFDGSVLIQRSALDIEIHIITFPRKILPVSLFDLKLSQKPPIPPKSYTNSLFSAEKHDLSIDPFKKPRPVQPSPVQRSNSKPSPSPSGLSGFDLLDSIMEGQDRTMQELNKSEEQKASERQRLEIERRRMSVENPYEKAAAISRGKPNIVH